jgi:two-component system, cell cycle sensor histidine kinase and response regulator CckA
MEIEGSVAPVRVSQELLGAVMTFRDASARHWEERQLRQAQRLEAAGRLAASAANEYTAAIAMIRKQTEHLLVRFSEYSPARPALEEIHQSATAADRITRRLAMFGTRQVGQPELLSVNSLLRRMSRLIESAAGDRIQVALRPSPGAGQIWADLAQMESAVMNLVTHARSAIARERPEGGQILIETARMELPHAGRSAAYVLLAVTYSGLEPDIDHLFDPAPTADSGLELAMVHSVVAECGGYVSARSGANGGSRIEILIPRVSDQALLPGPRETGGAALTILLVDGRSPVRAELHNFFEAAGYNLLEAADAGEAVALGEMHEGSLDLVVADAGQSDAILQDLRSSHPSLQALRISEQPEPGPGDIRRPFTRQALLDKVSALLGVQEAITSSSAEA